MAATPDELREWPPPTLALAPLELVERAPALEGVTNFCITNYSGNLSNTGTNAAHHAAQGGCTVYNGI